MKRRNQLGILELIIAAVDLSVAGTTASIQHDLLKDSAQKRRAAEEETLRKMEELKDQEIMQRQQANQKKTLIESLKDMGVEKLVKLSLGGLVGLSVLGLVIIYVVR